MPDEQKSKVTPEELAEQEAEELPERQAMTLISMPKPIDPIVTLPVEPPDEA